MEIRAVAIPHCIQACVRLVDSSRSSIYYLAHTFCPTVWEIIEGEASKEIWLSVNNFISTSSIFEKNRRVKQDLYDKKIWKVCLGQKWAQHGDAWFKSYDMVLLKWKREKEFLLRGVFRKELFTIPICQNTCLFLWGWGEDQTSITSPYWRRILYSQSGRCQHGSIESFCWQF